MEDTQDKLIEVIESDEFIKNVKSYYDEVIDELPLAWRDIDLFISFCKAYLCDKYNKATTSDKKIKLLMYYKESVFSKLMELIKGSCPRFNEFVCDTNVKYLNSLKKLKHDELYKALINYEGLISNVCIKEGNFIFIDDVKDKRVDCKMSDYEIKSIETAKIAIDLQNIIYSSFISVDGDEVKQPNSKLIEGMQQRKISFSTGKEGKKYKLLFNDGTIVDYDNGNINILSFSFQDLLNFVKLRFTEMYKSLNPLESDFMTIEDFETYVKASFNDIFSKIILIDKDYSYNVFINSNDTLTRIRKLLEDDN